MTFRVVTKYQSQYTKEVEYKTEYTPNCYAAVGAFKVYIEDPDCVLCVVDKVDSMNKRVKLVAMYDRE